MAALTDEGEFDNTPMEEEVKSLYVICEVIPNFTVTIPDISITELRGGRHGLRVWNSIENA